MKSELPQLMIEDPDEGFRQFMSAYKEPIYWYIRRLVVSHDDAMDVAQETFVRIFRSVGAFRGACSFRSWVYRIATHEALRLLARRDGAYDVLDAAENIPNDSYIDYDDHDALLLQRAIVNLPEKERIVFQLRYYDELDYQEIAAVLDSSIGTVKVHYHYARKKITEYIKKYADDCGLF